jgi:hypothetical protein
MIVASTHNASEKLWSDDKQRTGARGQNTRLRNEVAMVQIGSDPRWDQLSRFSN